MINDDDDNEGTDPTKPRDPVIGSEVSGYRVTNRLGVGGMGIVYEGEQPMIGKRVAIKVLRHEVADNPEVVQRLVSEARAVNKVGHRGIIDVFGFGSLPDGRQCIVMEYLDGEPLEAVMATYRKQKSVLPITDSLVILEEVLSALGAAHAAGVIHRDLKPSNIFLCRQRDGTQYVKLLDFGIAKLGVLGHTPATRASIMVGTPSYMAPEQASGGIVGPAMDLYAIGVLAFELLTGQQPFSADSVMEMLMKHQEATPPRVASLNMGVPDELDALVAKLLSKKPAERPESAEVVRLQITQLRKALADTTSKKLSVPSSPVVVNTTLVSPPPALALGADPQVQQQTLLKPLDPELEQSERTRLELQSTAVVSKPPQANSPEQRAPTERDLLRVTNSQAAIQRSKAPFVVLALLGVALVGGGIVLFGGNDAPVTQVAATPVPPLSKPSEPVAAVEPPKPTVQAAPEVATPEPAPAKPNEPIVATPEPTPAKPTEPVAKPPVDVKPAPVAPVEPVAKPAPIVAKAAGKDVTRLQQKVRHIEKNLTQAEQAGDNVALYRKALTSLKSKLGKPLSPADFDNLEVALSRLEEETAP